MMDESAQDWKHNTYHVSFVKDKAILWLGLITDVATL